MRRVSSIHLSSNDVDSGCYITGTAGNMARDLGPPSLHNAVCIPVGKNRHYTHCYPEETDAVHICTCSFVLSQQQVQQSLRLYSDDRFLKWQLRYHVYHTSLQARNKSRSVSGQKQSTCAVQEGGSSPKFHANENCEDMYPQ